MELRLSPCCWRIRRLHRRYRCSNVARIAGPFTHERATEDTRWSRAKGRVQWQVAFAMAIAPRRPSAPSSTTHLPFASTGVLTVTSRELSPAVRMARKLCKALSSRFVMERSQLQEAACQEVLVDRRKGSPWSKSRPPSAKDFEEGLSHALASGWVAESGHRIQLTPAGADVAYRLRVSQRKF